MLDKEKTAIDPSSERQNDFRYEARDARPLRRTGEYDERGRVGPVTK